MDVVNNYKVCDRCKNVIERHWGRRLDITKYKKKFFFGQYVQDYYMELCGGCNEKFDRFMDMELDDNKPTEYETFYEEKKERLAKKEREAVDEILS